MDAVFDCLRQMLGIDHAALMIQLRDSLTRFIAAKALVDHAGTTQRDVAQTFNLANGCAVSKQLARLCEVIKKDKGFIHQTHDILPCPATYLARSSLEMPSHLITS